MLFTKIDMNMISICKCKLNRNPINYEVDLIPIGFCIVNVIANYVESVH